MATITDTFCQKSSNFWLTLVRLLMQLLRTIFQGHALTEETVGPISPGASNGSGIDPRIAEHQLLLHRRAESYAKVELLHRLLVRQQLHELEQRRLIRLALARRRLQFSN
ncbi:uncharacterized protein [Drosophila pseudoobscura]|uniref:Uncharacterized protein n=1 Tax=Drosophila pseudoobscura pseudoobscura TaxID=46245 RepID=A0A6I8V076_DROPS|nr:uncharacterized protein LOC6901008 [Drosophila pseudoobscura]